MWYHRIVYPTCFTQLRNSTAKIYYFKFLNPPKFTIATYNITLDMRTACIHVLDWCLVSTPLHTLLLINCTTVVMRERERAKEYLCTYCTYTHLRPMLSSRFTVASELHIYEHFSSLQLPSSCELQALEID